MICLLRNLALVLMLMTASAASIACGTNANALIQGPFKAQLFDQGDICFQWSEDHRSILFYADTFQGGTLKNSLIDTYDYTDGPVQLLSVFFKNINKKPYIMVLLRWQVDYQQGGRQYQYYYKTKAYYKSDEGYQSDQTLEEDPALSGYQYHQHGLNASASEFKLDNADKIRSYLDRLNPLDSH